MNVLTLGLYAEGRTDERFLPIIIQRTTQDILIAHDRMSIEVNEPFIIKKPSDISPLDECILHAAQEVYDYHALIIHSDADNRTHQETLVKRFHPGYTLVQQENGRVCKTLIPIIPVRMVEAWMIADPDALRTALKVTVSLSNVGVPNKAKLVESEREPKKILDQVIQLAYARKPQSARSEIKGKLYERLAPLISLDRLKQVPSYHQFVVDMTTALKSINFIS
ncbi:MAG TPA: hypothetical protein DHW02_21245 [Ktedonobacter sp.]|nr:hypothetical protein [Ktedonobacter sp.]